MPLLETPSQITNGSASVTWFLADAYKFGLGEENVAIH